MLLLSDYEINACPKGRVKWNLVFNIDLTFFRWFITVLVNICDGAVYIIEYCFMFYLFMNIHP